MNQTSEDAAVSNSSPFYPTHYDYSRLLAGAHRRRVTPIGAPALTRHLVFWNPIEPPDPNHGDNSTDWTKLEEAYTRSRRLQADRLVAAIYNVLVEGQKTGKVSALRLTHPSTKATGEPVPLFLVWISELDGTLRTRPKGSPGPDSYRAIKIYFDWQGLPVVLSMELHIEFLTLTAIVDLSTRHNVTTMEESKGEKSFKDVVGSIEEICRLYETQDSHERDWRPHHKFIYYDFWKRFEHVIFSGDGILALKTVNGVQDPQRFVDFRGLILGVDRSDEGNAGRAAQPGGLRKPKQIDEALTSNKRLRAPFQRRSQTGTGNERPAICRIGDFDRIWPFLKSGFDDENTEFTLSRYLGDRAFFATALAEQRGMVGVPGSGPLCYLILEDTLNSWQLGRLIYRMHRAGTARVAASMHFDQIQIADGIIARAERKLQTSLQSATLLREQDEERERTAREDLRKDNDEIERELAGISDLHLDGSLDYRIERSRYYVSQFIRITDSLRIKRVQGFQTYVEFVEQRLGPVFDHIDRIGQRHARVQGDRGLLLRRLLTLEALYEERFISRAQRVADGALYGILGPYYLISIIEHAAWLNQTFLWRTGLAYSTLYLLLLAVKPNHAEGDRPVGLMSRLRQRLSRVRVRVIISLALALAGVAAGYAATPGGLDRIRETSDHAAASETDPEIHPSRPRLSRPSAPDGNGSGEGRSPVSTGN